MSENGEVGGRAAKKTEEKEQCFEIFGFQIFGFGFPNNFKTSNFVYRIRSFMHQEKKDKKGVFLSKKIFDGQIKFGTILKKKSGLFFYPYKKRTRKGSFHRSAAWTKYF